MSTHRLLLAALLTGIFLASPMIAAAQTKPDDSSSELKELRQMVRDLSARVAALEAQNHATQLSSESAAAPTQLSSSAVPAADRVKGPVSGGVASASPVVAQSEAQKPEVADSLAHLL